MDDAAMFDRPVPGQSLTKPPGSSKMEQPPQFVDVGEACEYFWDKLTQPKKALEMEILLRKDTPVDYITRNIIFTAIANGIVSVDVGMLVAPIVYNQIIAIAELKKIPYIEMEEDHEFNAMLDENLDLLNKQETKKEDKQAVSLGIFDGIKA